MSTHPPQAGDSVATWFAPGIAERLEATGMPTLSALIARINRAGPTWWYAVAGIGVTKNRHILAWLRAHEHSIGIAVVAAA